MSNRQRRHRKAATTRANNFPAVRRGVPILLPEAQCVLIRETEATVGFAHHVHTADQHADAQLEAVEACAAYDGPAYDLVPSAEGGIIAIVPDKTVTALLGDVRLHRGVWTLVGAVPLLTGDPRIEVDAEGLYSLPDSAWPCWQP